MDIVPDIIHCRFVSYQLCNDWSVCVENVSLFLAICLYTATYILCRYVLLWKQFS